jgi:enediyne polyketide synthase
MTKDDTVMTNEGTVTTEQDTAAGHHGAHADARATPPLPLRRPPRTGPSPIMRRRAETVFAVRGTDRADLAETLDTIAVKAAQLPADGLREFALELAAPGSDPACQAPSGADHRARAAIVASDPDQLSGRARNAAEALRSPGPGLQRAPSAAPGVYLSEDAAGRVVLLFPGLASTAVEHSAVLSASMATLSATERLGVQPSLAVGYSFGEIAGLAWAGAITFDEAARFATQLAEIISATPGRAAMARVCAGPVAVARLCAGTSLVLAAREGPAQHVLAGPVSHIRELPQRAAAMGVEVEVMSITHALHSPAMLPSVPPTRAAAEGLRFTAPKRRLVSTVTGLDVTASADIPELIAGQLARPALLADALALACGDADLILLAARDPALGRVAGAYGHVPVIQAPIEQQSGYAMPALAAFFAARAVDDISPFLRTNNGDCGPDASARPGEGDLAGSQADALAARA